MTITVVRFFSFTILSVSSMISSAVFGSSAAVCSSRIKNSIGVIVDISSAIAWRCPPESRIPRSPMVVSSPSGSPSTNSFNWASSRIFQILLSSIRSSSIPNAILSRMDSSTRYILCGIYPICASQDS